MWGTQVAIPLEIASNLSESICFSSIVELTTWENCSEDDMRIFSFLDVMDTVNWIDNSWKEEKIFKKKVSF